MILSFQSNISKNKKLTSDLDKLIGIRMDRGRDARRDVHGVSDDPVFDAIMQAITLRQIIPGTKLGEDFLAEMFKTNRMNIRRVLSLLSFRGVVTLEPNRGAFVSRPSPQESIEVFTTRRILERSIISELARHRSEDDITILRTHNRLEKEAKRQDRMSFLALSADFHILLAERVNNRIILKFMHEITTRTSLIIAEYEQTASPDCSAECHPHLVDLIEAKDELKAVELMDQHLTDMQNRLSFRKKEQTPDEIRNILLKNLS